ncbi:MAG TPA: PVC-type heme-binding CxxCH protein, partial [Verrucomicrobiae bacterium]|nr:PVC-type heme-binding CxxCH protein [Verrucomicrobiae bacterium]
MATMLAGPILHAADPFAENVRTTDPVSPEQERKGFHLPPGFEIQLVAAEPDLRKPMNMAFDGKGRLWVTESREYPFPVPVGQPGRDSIRIFSDFDESGRARKMQIFAEGLNIPIGIYPYKNGCFAWSIPNIWWFEDTDGDGKADKKELLYGPFDHTRDTHGNQSSFNRGFDGWLYATHGFNNDSHVRGRDTHQVDMNSGNVYRIRLDGSRIEHYTWGQVNPFGMDFDPRGNIYTSDCHSMPIYQLLAGGYYPSFGKPHDGLGFAPVVMEHLHGSTAIDGLVFYNDNLWPAEYQDNVFIGNVMTSRLNRDHLVFNGSSPRAMELPDFLTADDPWFRPVNNVLGPDGALYVADFYNRIIGHYEVPLQHPGRDRERGRLWRIVYRGPDGKAKLHRRTLDLTQANSDQLIGELKDPNLTWRMLAMNELVDRFGKTVVPAEERAYNRAASAAKRSTESGYQAAHLLWALYRDGALNYEEIRKAATNPNALVRVHAMRVLKNIAGWSPPYTRLVLDALKDRDALVARCAAEAIGEHPRYDLLAPLLDARRRIPTNDTHYVYVARKAIRDLLLDDSISAKVLSSSWTESDRAIFADVAVAVPSANASTLLLRELPRLSQEANPVPPVAEVLKHAARYAPEAELGRLASFARQQLPAGNDAALYRELDRQFTLFKSVEQGLQQRGVKQPPVIRDWGMELVNRYFKSMPGAQDSSLWTALPFDSDSTDDPWGYEKRHCTDGVDRRLFSSLPFGESLTGVIRSPEFEAPERISFWLCGHDGFPDKTAQKLNAVRLRDAVTGGVLAETFAPRNDVARKITWDTASFKGRRVLVEATDG